MRCIRLLIYIKSQNENGKRNRTEVLVLLVSHIVLYVRNTHKHHSCYSHILVLDYI